MASPSLNPQAARPTMFLLAALGWSLSLFALLRSPWAEGWLVLPLTQLQEQVAEAYAGPPPTPLAVTPECSGTDVLALCLAAILAWPAPWRDRLLGATGGVALVLALNTARIATLGRASASPALFETLHLQVWPVILITATASYVFVWMRRDGDWNRQTATPVRLFMPRAAVLLIAFALCGPWLARSEALALAGAWTARAAAFFLAAAGLPAAASGNALATSRGSFVVTPDCLVTALIPLYVAGVLAVRGSWPWRALALLAALPLFGALAVVRLLLLALPVALVSSPLFVVHGFHQIVLAALAVVLLALVREPLVPALERAGIALSAAVVFVIVAGAALSHGLVAAARAVAVVAPHTLTELVTPGDMQGALATLPAFQAGFLLALGLSAVAGWRHLLLAFGALLLSELSLLVVLGELADHAHLVPHALVLRAWAVGVPMALTLAMLRAESHEPLAFVTRPPADHGVR